MNFVYDWIMPPIVRIGFEDVLLDKDFILINTLPSSQQGCLIYNTISVEEEEMILNKCIENYDSKTKMIILYGRNSADATVDEKARQLKKLGFVNVYVYGGGLFEWLLLQDIYGSDMFKTTSKLNDILQYKPLRLT